MIVKVLELIGQKIRQLVDNLHIYNFPLNVLVVGMNWHYTDPGFGGWTGWTWNRRLFPESVKFLDYFKSNDLKIKLNLHPANSVALYEEKYSKITKTSEQRDYRFFEDFVYHPVAEARSKSTEKVLGFDSHIHAFDSITIYLCLEVFEWANLRKNKSGIKVHVHVLYNIEAKAPELFHITTASANDMMVMPEILYEKKHTTSSIAVTVISPISSRLNK